MNDPIQFPSLDDFIAQTGSAPLQSSDTAEKSQDPMVFPDIQADTLDISKRKELGEAYAELYIKAQGLCQLTSNSVCELAQSKIDDRWFRYGFNQRMGRSEFSVRLDIRDRQR